MTPEQTILKASIAVDKAFDQLTKPSETKKIASKMNDQIKKRSRLNFGVNEKTRNRYRFPSLSDSYKEQRKGNITFITINRGGENVRIPIKPKRKPKLSKYTRSTRSNITATGLLLDSMGFSGGIRKISVFIKNIRYNKDIYGNRVKNAPTTTDVVGFLREQGRTFLLLTRSEEKKIRRDLGARINKLALKLFET